MAIEPDAIVHAGIVPADGLLVALVNFLLIFTRVFSFLLFSYFFGNKLILSKIKLAFALMISALVFENVPHKSDVFNLVSLLLTVIFESLIGFVLSFIFQFLFQVIVFFSDLVSNQTGLNFAVLFDPTVESSTPIIGQFFLLMLTLIFLKMNLHLEFIQIVMQSFKWVGLGAHLDQIQWSALVHLLGFLLRFGIKMSLPLLTLVLMVNMAFGLMAKISPQLNIFTFGMPLALLMSFAFIVITLDGFSGQVDEIWLQLTEWLTQRVFKDAA